MAINWDDLDNWGGNVHEAASGSWVDDKHATDRGHG